MLVSRHRPGFPRPPNGETDRILARLPRPWSAETLAASSRRAHRALQRLLTRHLRPDWHQRASYFRYRFGRWGPGAALWSQFKLQAAHLKRSAALPVSCVAAWVRWWFNAYFTGRRMRQNRGEPCPFCSSFQALHLHPPPVAPSPPEAAPIHQGRADPNFISSSSSGDSDSDSSSSSSSSQPGHPYWDEEEAWAWLQEFYGSSQASRVLAVPQQNPTDCLEHFRHCWALTSAAHHIGLIEDKTTSWYLRFLQGRFGRPRLLQGSSRAERAQKQTEEFTRWLLIVFECHNTLCVCVCVCVLPPVRLPR